MMKVIPAIDLMNHTVVRLVEGDFNRKTAYHTNPLQQALVFQEAGFSRLHMVDLEGARLGKPQHIQLLREISAGTNLQIDFGGGVRTEEDVKQILDAGAVMISLGSIAVKDPERVSGWVKQFGPDKFFLGADVLDQMIATNAWLTKSNLTVFAFIDFWMKQNITSFFSTDVSRDGKLEGPAVSLYVNILERFPGIDLVASGGVSSLSDLEALDETGVSGVIVGKAIYEERIELEELNPWK